MRFVIISALILLAAPLASGQELTDRDIINRLKFTAPDPNDGRGVRPNIRFTAPSAPPAVRSAAFSNQPPERAQEHSVSLTVEFETGSATLTSGAEHSLAALGRALASDDLAGNHFRLEGHTDTVGVPDRNRTLSERRAASVAAFLEQRFNIAAQRLRPVGMGEDELIVPTPDQTAEPRNRAVRVVNLGL